MLDSAKSIQSKMNFVHTSLVQKNSRKIYPQGTFCLPVLKGLKGRLSLSVIIKGQDNSGLERWTFTTLLGRNNNKTTIFNVYCPGNTAVELVGNSIVIKQ